MTLLWKDTKVCWRVVFAACNGESEQNQRLRSKQAFGKANKFYRFFQLFAI